VTYAFTFDASACSGCKACQVACKDKNNLPVGVLWRRVYEVSGGTWTKQNDAWVADVFAYNLSIACNHCVHPKCAGVCPTDAYVQREDGIVYIDESKCIGCGYCNWACPYGVPQYDPLLGHMTKCNFCMDNIDAGLPPACVAACPLRVLDYVTVDTSPSPPPSRRSTGSTGDVPLTVDGKKPLWLLPASEHPFPMPENSRTEPHLAIKPHMAMINTLDKAVSNREEVKPVNSKSELPLVAFTLLGQMAAGLAVFALFSGPLTTPMLVAIGGLIGLGGLASFLHLGAPKNAWRAVIHLRKSWLSREILMFGLFGGSWLIALALPGMGKLPLTLCGLGLVYSMAQVYRLRSMPAWDTNRTSLAFFVSAALLGGIGVEILNNSGKTGSMSFTNLVLGAGLIVVLGLSLLDRNQTHRTARGLRLGLIGLGLVGALGVYVAPNAVGRWLVVPIFVIILIEEVLGRWLFYEQLHQRIL
jgi:anaerobic dimethyl sulfoxide reductase subunit B (iron-sulfur subunit)